MADLTIQEQELQRLEEIAQEYIDKGYRVLFQPQADQRPDFLKPFQPDLIVSKGDEYIVVEVKSRGQLGEETQVKNLARAVREKHNWKFELVLLGPENALSVGQALPLTPEEIRQTIEEARRLLENKSLEAALLVAWSAAEAALRTLAEQEDIGARQAVPAYLLKQMAAEGVISQQVYHALMDILKIRQAVAHGFKTPKLTAGVVKGLISEIENSLLAQRELLNEL